MRRENGGQENRSCPKFEKKKLETEGTANNKKRESDEGGTETSREGKRERQFKWRLKSRCQDGKSEN